MNSKPMCIKFEGDKEDRFFQMQAMMKKLKNGSIDAYHNYFHIRTFGRNNFMEMKSLLEVVGFYLAT